MIQFYSISFEKFTAQVTRALITAYDIGSINLLNRNSIAASSSFGIFLPRLFRIVVFARSLMRARLAKGRGLTESAAKCFTSLAQTASDAKFPGNSIGVQGGPQIITGNSLYRSLGVSIITQLCSRARATPRARIASTAFDVRAKLSERLGLLAPGAFLFSSRVSKCLALLAQIGSETVLSAKANFTGSIRSWAVRFAALLTDIERDYFKSGHDVNLHERSRCVQARLLLKQRAGRFVFYHAEVCFGL